MQPAVTPYPSFDRRTKTGSNLRNKSVPALRKKEIAAGGRALDRAAQVYRRKCRQLFSRADLRIAQEIVSRATRELHRTNLKRGSDASRWDATRDETRARISRLLARELPAYREWRKLARAYQRDYQRLVRGNLAARSGGQVHVDLSEVVPPDSGDTRVFVAPFSVYDVESQGDGVIVQDHSAAVPSIGHVINQFEFSHEDDGPIVNDFYGINWRGRLFSSAMCGVNFTTPRAGRLRIGAALQSFYNRITCSVQDRFGFSEAELSIDVRLVLSVVQPDRVTTLRKTILTGGLSSFGKDLGYQLPELAPTALHVVEATTDESYAANAGVQVLAGCEVFVLSDIDDMRTFVNALLWWQLKKLTIDVV